MVPTLFLHRVTTNLQFVKKKKKKRVSAKYSKTGYACIRNPVLVYRNGQTSEQLLKYTMGFCQHECYVKTYFHKPLEKEIDLLISSYRVLVKCRNAVSEHITLGQRNETKDAFKHS